MKNTADYLMYFGGLIASIVLGGSILVGLYGGGAAQPIVGSGGMPNIPDFRVASTTTFTLTTTSQRLLATTTTGNGRRVAATIQPTNCTVATAAVYLNVEGADAVAVANSGIAIVASTTLSFGAFPNAPLVNSAAVQGIATAGTCAVLVTEWITQ